MKLFDIMYGDGVGVHLAARFLGPTMHDYTIRNATDLNHALLNFANRHSKRIFVLGSTQHAIDKFIERARHQYPDIQIVGYQNGYADIDSSVLIQQINNAGTDILLVGMGQPLQELWYERHRETLAVPAVVMVGGFIDFYSGHKKRAPKIIRAVGLEWLFRLLLEPKRLWRRYILGIPHFIFIIVKQKFVG
ncbi:MAG: WecB/TagA/CpsF family glycosyltransferase [Ignavibacteriales bacterium]|nr:WecB/TagA/CpsF family glycosyltransferase [Ignavibacteriales bacterium]